MYVYVFAYTYIHICIYSLFNMYLLNICLVSLSLLGADMYVYLNLCP